MSDKKSIIQTMLGRIFFAVIFLILGGAMLFRTYTQMEEYAALESDGLMVVGEIQSVNTVYDREVVAGGKKSLTTHYRAEVLVIHEEHSYLDSVEVTGSMQAGDLIEVYLNTSTSEMIPVFSTTGNLLNFLSYVPGILVTGLGVVIVLCSVVSAIRSFRMLKESA